MGVAITELIPKKEISIQSLSGKKLSVDASNILYQFIASIRQPDGTPLQDKDGNTTSHLMGLSTRIPNLIENNLKLCFVFDGKHPQLKNKEKELREARKQLAEKKLKKAEKEKDVESIAKYKKQTIRLTDEIVKESKELIEAFGLPIIQAPLEADAQIAHLNKKNDVWACISTDIDCLLHSAPRMVRNLTVSQRKKIKGIYLKVSPELIELKRVLKHLKINQDQLLALAILQGTDYNPGGVKGIGPKTALKLVQQHKKFDKIFQNVEADFNWKKIYATFKSMPIMKNYQLKWKEPNIDKITKILSKHDFSEERINKIIEKVTPKPQKNLDKWF